ncbi:MAG: sugar ABC transporter permease [Clostridia bacterium]|nr:sugar ABC transporter permease [Clostridia bacterium]
MENLVKKTKGLTRTQNRLIFYCIMLIWPVIQTSLFYFYVNFNTFALAFQEVDFGGATHGFTLNNFSIAWNELIVGQITYILNSLKFFAIDFPIALVLALTFSFYIYKKYPGAGLFKTMLFMPSLLSGLVFCILFKYLSSYGYQEIRCLLDSLPVTATNRQAYTPLLEGVDTAMPTVIFFNIWISFGSNILLYSGAMSGIDESVVESSKLDGANLLQEMFHITLPLIFPTIISLVVVSLTGVFTNQLSLVSLFGETFPNEDVKERIVTVGYKMFIYAKHLTTASQTNMDMFGSGYYDAGELSAYGLAVSVVIIPMVLGIRKLMKKYGPSTD